MDDNSLGIPIKDGKIDETSYTTKKSERKTGEMGKDEFLQLLVAQMKYQDPLQPTDNTEYVSQLATFSSLEQMQNLNQTSINSQAFGLVGQEVIMETKTSTGNVSYKQGVVDFVTITGNKAYLSIDKQLYPAEDLYSVVGQHYIASNKAPVVEETELSYNHDKPEDVSIEVSMGEDEYQANKVALFINEEVIEAKYMEYKDGKIIINKDAFKKLDTGKYNIVFMFNDIYATTYGDKVTIKVSGTKPAEPEVEDPDKDPTDPKDPEDNV